MHEVKTLSISEVVADADQPRKNFAEPELLALGQNMLLVKQQVPVIVWKKTPADGVAANHVLVDGERRWRAAQLAGIDQLHAIVLDRKPSVAELAVLRCSLDIHRASMSAIERSDALAGLQKETGKSISELAELLGISQSFASKHLALQRLAPAIRAQVAAGELDLERGYIISQGASADEQLVLSQGARKLTRSQLRDKARNGPSMAKAKAKDVRIEMPGGFQLRLQGNDLSFELVVEVLAEALRMLKKGKAQGLTLASQIQVMADQSKASRRTLIGGAV